MTEMQAQLGQLYNAVPPRIWLALGVLVLGVLLSIVVGAVNRRLLERAGLPSIIEGTGFERLAQGLGTSTIAIVAQLSTYFLIGLTIVVALTVADVGYTDTFWTRLVAFLPRLFVALLILIVGILIGDKVELLVAERLRGVKLPEIGLIPTLAKYSVFYLAILVALSQVRINTLALVVLLGAYAFALVVFASLAFKDMLSSAAAGIYLLLNQPYTIGDQVKLGEQSGIVQEVDMLVTRVETDNREYIIPNRAVFEEGIVRVYD
ncbi:mechanosensitive ion channel domain-containing protein [Haloprofundus marisrubri]